MRLPRILVRLRLALFGEALRREIDDEIQSHLEFETRKYLSRGIAEEEARRRANIAFGGKAGVLEECREWRGVPFLENILRDCRHALRIFRRAPVFSLAVVLTAALGIGANATIFALCKAMLLATLPVPNPQQLHLVSIAYPDITPYPYFSFPDLQKLQKAVSGTAALTGFTEIVDVHVQDQSGATSTIKGQLVAGNFFSVLRVSPIAGRLLTELDNRPQAEAVAVLSCHFWKTRFASDPEMIGRRLLIQRHPVTVLAIMPEGFKGVQPGSEPDIWMPLSIQSAIGFQGYAAMNGIDPQKPWLWQDVSWLHVLARSPNDQEGRRLRAQLTHLLKAEVTAQLPHVTDPRERAMMLHADVMLTNAEGGLPRLREQFSLPLRILAALVVVLLFSGCVNIVNLLFARSRAHRREMAIRLALGASRARLISNRLIEPLILVATGGLVALPLALWGSKFTLYWLVTGHDLQIEIAPDWRLFCFTAIVTIVIGLLVGLLPAFKAADFAGSGALGHRGVANAPARGASRLSAALVAGQLALSFASLVIAGLLTQTLLSYAQLDVGMDRQHVLSVSIDASAAGYDNRAKLNAFYRDLTAAIDRIPGVISSSVAGCGLMRDGCATVPATLGGQSDKSKSFLIERNYVGPGYLSTVGMRLLDGRGITEYDSLRSIPIGVVNAEFERRFFADHRAIGAVIRVEDQDIQIVGIVEDARSDNIHSRALPYIFLPVEQAPTGWNISALEIRTRGNPEVIANSVRSAILGINRAIPIAQVTTLTNEINRGLTSELLVGRLAGLFSALTLVIGGLGLYGVFAYETTLRRPEFAVRLTVGATKRNIICIVFRRAATILVTGSAAGYLLAISVARLMNSLFFETQPVQKWAYAGSLFMLLLCSNIAVLLPALRAGSLDPACMMRSE